MAMMMDPYMMMQKEKRSKKTHREAASTHPSTFTSLNHAERNLQILKPHPFQSNERPDRRRTKERHSCSAAAAAKSGLSLDPEL